MLSDTNMSDASSVSTDEDATRFFKIAIDFGTTCSSVAYLDTQNRPEPHPDRIVSADETNLITGFPDSARNSIDLLDQKRVSVPSQCWYGPRAVLRTTRNRRLPESAEAMYEVDSEVQEQLSNEREQTYQWGYGVQNHINCHDPQKQKGVYIDYPKLLLDNGRASEKPRALLKSKIDRLREIRPIKNDLEPVIEYLSHLLRHSRQHLEKEADFDDDCQVEFVICVPTAWKAQATMHMQRVVEAAIRRSAFLKRNHPSLRNLFIVSEPEAASMCVLERGRGHLGVGDTFIILDAGGGTVDATCYTVAAKTPLRLLREETMPEGVLCGSSYLNLALHDLLHDRLTKADFEPADVNLDQIIEKAVFEFEYGLKRRINVFTDGAQAIHLPGLKRDQKRNLFEDRLYLKANEWQQLFEHCLTGTSGLLLSQIEAARAKSLNPKKVVMIGGFAESPSLRRHIDDELTRYNQANGTKIKRILTSAPSTAVAQGAVLRSLRKDQCPERIVQFSYGFKTDEDYSPDNEDEEIRRAHAEAIVSVDGVDGVEAVKDTIFWTIQKGETLEPTDAYRYFNRYVFGSKEKFECMIEVFMSDQNCQSHYQKKHEKNKSAQSVASVSVDMTFLKDENLIKPSTPAEPTSKDKREVWEVPLDIVMRINGRTLRFEACWPPVSRAHGRLKGEHPGQVKKSCEISIAGAFAHGTA